jgi:hypothetical protein
MGHNIQACSILRFNAALNKKLYTCSELLPLQHNVSVTIVLASSFVGAVCEGNPQETSCE